MAKADLKRQPGEEVNAAQNPRISVLMPAFEVVEHIEETVRKIVRTLEETRESFEVVVVNDGSSDETREVLKELADERECLRFVSYRNNQGKGFALKTGFDHVEGDLVFFMDADSDLDPKRIHRFLEEMENTGSDIVIGSKKHPESEVNYPLKRTILSKGYSLLLRVLFGLGVTDTQVGMKLFKREVLDDVMPLVLVKKYAFDVEILSLAKRKGYSVSEAPVEIHLDPEFSNISWTTVAHMAWDTATVFYRLKILRYYQKREKEVRD